MAFDAATALIHSCTGLSPAQLFTIAALMVGVFSLVSWGFFVSPKETQSRKIPPVAAESSTEPSNPVELVGMTLEELRSYDGSERDKPLLMAIKGQIYDVSPGRILYGPGGPYSLFAGRETSRAMALMSFDSSDLNDNLSDLTTTELEILQDWDDKFKEKYAKVGQIISAKAKVGDSENSDMTKRLRKLIKADVLNFC